MKILLPVDLSQPIQPTISILRATAQLADSDLHLLYVQETLPAYESVLKTAGSFVDDLETQLKAKAQQQLEEWAALLKPQCHSVSCEIARGPAFMTINSIADDGAFDLTVLSPRLRSFTEKFLLGSVSSRVADSIKRTVLIARPLKSQVDSLKNVVIGFDGSANAKVAIQVALKIFR